MRISGNSVLITGDATGIGLALAEDFLKEGNEVVICGRQNEKLDHNRKKFPDLQTKKCDVADKKDKKRLYDWMITTVTFFLSVGFSVMIVFVLRKVSWGWIIVGPLRRPMKKQTV